MKRRLFNVLAGVSLLLCVLLILDYNYRPLIPLSSQSMVITQSGGVETFTYHATGVSAGHLYSIFGLHISDRMALIVTGAIPLIWLLLGIIAMFTSMLVTHPGPGCCPRCGYDLRATPDRCPECGHVPEKVKSTS